MGTSLSNSEQGFLVNAREYYQLVQNTINNSRLVIASDVSFNEVDTNECYVRGVLTLLTGFELHIAEYVITSPILERLKYRYHLQNTDNTLVSRWDNVPHHPQVATFPHHQHDANGTVHACPPMDIATVLKAVIPLVIFK